MTSLYSWDIGLEEDPDPFGAFSRFKNLMKPLAPPPMAQPEPEAPPPLPLPDVPDPFQEPATAEPFYGVPEPMPQPDLPTQNPPPAGYGAPPPTPDFGMAAEPQPPPLPLQAPKIDVQGLTTSFRDLPSLNPQAVNLPEYDFETQINNLIDSVPGLQERAFIQESVDNARAQGPGAALQAARQAVQETGGNIRAVGPAARDVNLTDPLSLLGAAGAPYELAGEGLATLTDPLTRGLPLNEQIRRGIQLAPGLLGPRGPGSLVGMGGSRLAQAGALTGAVAGGEAAQALGAPQFAGELPGTFVGGGLPAGLRNLSAPIAEMASRGKGDLPHPGSLYGYTPAKAPNFGTPEAEAMLDRPQTGARQGGGVENLTSVRGTMPRWEDQGAGMGLDMAAFDPDAAAKVGQLTEQLGTLPKTGSRQANVNKELGTLEAQALVQRFMEETQDAGRTLDRVADVIEDATDAARNTRRTPRQVAFEEELNRIWDEPSLVPLETPVPPRAPTVRKVDLFGNETDTFQTEAELAGFREEQAGFGLNAPREAAPVPAGQEALLTARPQLTPVTLPNDLAGAKPRYSYGGKGYGLEFESDVDKAAYITAQTKPSRRDNDYLEFAMAATGKTGPEVRAYGQTLRDSIKQQARVGEAGTTLTVAEGGGVPSQVGVPGAGRIPEVPAEPAAAPAALTDTLGGAPGSPGGVAGAPPPPREPPAPPVPPSEGGGIPPQEPGFAGNIRLEKFPSEVQGVIKQYADAHPDIVQEARRGVRSDQQVLDDARALTEEVGGSFDRLQRSWKPGQAWNAEEVTAIRGVLLEKTQGVLEAANASVLDDSLQNHARLVLAIQEQVAIQNVVHGVTAEAGRALRAFRQMATELEMAVGAGQAENVQSVLGKIGGAAGMTRTGIDEVANKLVALQRKPQTPATVKAINKYTKSTTKPGFWDYAHAWYINSILSGPMTHIRNAASNVVMTATSPIERGVAAGVEAVVAPLQGRQRERFFSEAPADVVGALNGVADGVRAALITMKDGISPTQASKWEGMKRIPSGPGGINRVWTAPTTMLEAADAFNYKVNFSAALYAGAQRMARTEGRKGASVAQRVQELIDNPPSRLVEQADKTAEYRLFRAKPGEWTQGFLDLRNKFPPAKFVIPFLRTPANLLKMGIERSPAALLNYGEEGIWRNLMEKNPEASDKIARMLMGTALASGLAALYATGQIDMTLAAPSYTDAGARDRFFREGKLPYSITLPGIGTLQYRQLEPLNQTFAQVASVIDVVKKGGDPTQAASKALITIADMLSDQTYLSGLADVANVITDPERYGQQYLQRQAGSAIPFSAGLRQTGNILDPTFRDPEGIVEQLKANLPVLSEQVPARQTAFGRDTTRPNPLSPFQFTTREQSELDAALEESGREVGFVGRSIASYKLNREQQQAYQQAAGRITEQALTETVKALKEQSVPVELWETILEKVQAGAREAIYGPITDIIKSDADFARAGKEEKDAIILGTLRAFVEQLP